MSSNSSQALRQVFSGTASSSPLSQAERISLGSYSLVVDFTLVPRYEYRGRRLSRAGYQIRSRASIVPGTSRSDPRRSLPEGITESLESLARRLPSATIASFEERGQWFGLGQGYCDAFYNNQLSALGERMSAVIGTDFNVTVRGHRPHEFPYLTPGTTSAGSQVPLSGQQPSESFTAEDCRVSVPGPAPHCPCEECLYPRLLATFLPELTCTWLPPSSSRPLPYLSAQMAYTAPARYPTEGERKIMERRRSVFESHINQAVRSYYTKPASLRGQAGSLLDDGTFKYAAREARSYMGQVKVIGFLSADDFNNHQ